MELLDLLIEIERYVTRNGLSHDDSIEHLIDSINESLVGE